MQPIVGEHMPIIGHGSRGLFGNIYIRVFQKCTFSKTKKVQPSTYQSVTNIFEYSNILVTNIYSDIRSYQCFFYEYIRTFVRVKFVCTNIFGHSLVSVLECKT